MSVPALLDSFAATATGFRCVCNGQPHEFLDDDVVGLRVQASCIAGANGRTRNQERLSIRVADPSIPVIEVDTEFTGPDDNFLAAFHQRLLANLSLCPSAHYWKKANSTAVRGCLAWTAYATNIVANRSRWMKFRASPGRIANAVFGERDLINGP